MFSDQVPRQLAEDVPQGAGAGALFSRLLAAFDDLQTAL